MIFAIESLENIWDEFIVLCAEHWKETEGYRHNQPFNLSKERYLGYEKAGWYLQFTARDEGKLVGHVGIYVLPSMHSQQLIANEDMLFLLPEARKGRNALRLHQFVEDEMRRRGVVEITATVKPFNNAGKLLEYLGYSMVTYGYSKHLTQCADSAITPLMESDYVRPITPATT